MFDRICNMIQYGTSADETICHEMFTGQTFVLCLLKMLTALFLWFNVICACVWIVF
jgi:hypothetical protein